MNGTVYYIVLMIILIFVSVYMMIYATKRDSAKKNKHNQIMYNELPIEEHEQETSVDELYKYKELLDMGAITQEEFEAKKNELLGL